MLNQIIEIRRQLHKIPEEGYKEVKTRDYICSKLNEYKIEYEVVLNTAVIAYINIGKQHSVAFRADMDGLCIEEGNDIDYKSQKKGFMHACGHDGHMTAVLIAAKIINENKSKLKENAVFIFQPAEEGPGGAQDIVNTGILDKYNVSRIYATHLNPEVKEGEIALRKGWFMAQTGEFYISVCGKSAHAAKPGEGINSILAASLLITAVEDIKKILNEKNENALISIGTIKGGQRVNVIAEKTILSGTMRTYSTKTRSEIKQMINEKAKEIDVLIGTNTIIDYEDLYPAVYNDEDLYDDFIKKIPQAINTEPSMLSEDFAYFQQKIPGLFFYTGTLNIEKGFIYPLHSNKFNFDEKALLSTVDVYLKIAGVI